MLKEIRSGLTFSRQREVKTVDVSKSGIEAQRRVAVLDFKLTN